MVKLKEWIGYLLVSLAIVFVVILIASQADPVIGYMLFLVPIICPVHATICLLIDLGLRKTPLKARKIVSFFLGGVATFLLLPVIFYIMTNFVW